MSKTIGADIRGRVWQTRKTRAYCGTRILYGKRALSKTSVKGQHGSTLEHKGRAFYVTVRSHVVFATEPDAALFDLCSPGGPADCTGYDGV